jgi:calcium/calmodulin-dependent protein kinase (CaM kinase) II/calcium/calmodulin-dependent protein kinase I
MWSIGVIMYILLGGYPPFHENTHKLLFQKIKSGKFRLSVIIILFNFNVLGEYEFHREYWKDVSTEARNLISGLLVVDMKKRLTVDQALKHPWVMIMILLHNVTTFFTVFFLFLLL